MSYGRRDYLIRHIQVSHEEANNEEFLPRFDFEELEDVEAPELLPGPEVVLKAEEGAEEEEPNAGTL